MYSYDKNLSLKENAVIVEIERRKKSNKPWYKCGLCFMDDNDWYTTRHDNESKQQLLDICKVCPVRIQCLDDAIDTEVMHYSYGIWGGATAKTRRQISSKSNKGSSLFRCRSLNMPKKLSCANPIDVIEFVDNRNVLCSECGMKV